MGKRDFLFCASAFSTPFNQRATPSSMRSGKRVGSCCSIVSLWMGFWPFFRRTFFKRETPELQEPTGTLSKLIYFINKLIYPQKWT
jgi:hypothetical protein